MHFSTIGGREHETDVRIAIDGVTLLEVFASNSSYQNPAQTRPLSRLSRMSSLRNTSPPGSAQNPPLCPYPPGLIASRYSATRFCTEPPLPQTSRPCRFEIYRKSPAQYPPFVPTLPASSRRDTPPPGFAQSPLCPKPPGLLAPRYTALCPAKNPLSQTSRIPSLRNTPSSALQRTPLSLISRIPSLRNTPSSALQRNLCP